MATKECVFVCSLVVLVVLLLATKKGDHEGGGSQQPEKQNESFLARDAQKKQALQLQRNFNF